MVRFIRFLSEELNKNVWSHLVSDDKSDYSEELISLVNNAYSHTSLGSFIRSFADVQQSDWLVLDYDNAPDPDVAIFYRKSRGNEPWVGKKIQGIGYKNIPAAKSKVMTQVSQLLNSGEYWIEASDAMARALSRTNRPITDQQLLKTVFPGIIKFYDDGSYDRQLNSEKIHEIVFGTIQLK